MRKILSREEIEKKRKRTSLIMSLFLLVLLLLSTAGFAFIYSPGSVLSDSNNNEENPELVNIGDQWVINIQGQPFYFSTAPDLARGVTTEFSKTLQNYPGTNLYISSDNEEVTQKIATTLGRFAYRTQEACYGPCPERDFPEKDCTENLIVWQNATENRVYQKENCIFIEGDLTAVDAFLYRLFGLI